MFENCHYRQDNATQTHQQEHTHINNGETTTGQIKQSINNSNEI